MQVVRTDLVTATHLVANGYTYGEAAAKLGQPYPQPGGWRLFPQRGQGPHDPRQDEPLHRTAAGKGDRPVEGCPKEASDSGRGALVGS